MMCPSPLVDWSQIEATFPYVAAMRECDQDPVYHAEGDVWTHTKMVMAALQQIDRADDRALRLTALYHDCRKPETRTVEHDAAQARDVIKHPYHARLGAATAWYDLWMLGDDLPIRLTVYWLCAWHQRVFHVWTTGDMERATLSFAAVDNWPRLISFARADIIGRVCSDAQETLDNLNLFESWLDEFGDRPLDAQFWQNDYDRIFYFEKAGRSPWYRAQPPVGSRVTILSGLPGVGKDTHYKSRLHDVPMISLDAIRDRLRIKPTDNQGRVIQAAFEQARIYLRAKHSFVWNAQCVTRQTRDKIIHLCRAYDAHVSIHAFDRPLATILNQMQQRERQVPVPIIMAAARKWEPPSLLEAHSVEWV
jgi:predicted kinase